MKRFIITGLVALFVLPHLLVACGDELDDNTLQSLDFLNTPGPHAVGYRQLSLTYRPDGSDEDRTLLVEVWYPAVAETGTETTYTVAGLVEVPREGVATDAEMVPDESWPVLVYSHGNGGVGLVGFSDGEYFASWGWLVVAPDHTGNTVVDPTNPIAFDFLTRPQDVSAALDWLESGAPDPIGGRGSDEVLVVGHSFGGYSALAVAGARHDVAAQSEACEAYGDGSCAIYEDAAARAALEAGYFDPRVDAIVPQAAGVGFADGELADLDLPTLWMTARLDNTVTWENSGEPGWSLLDGPDDIWVDLTRGGHFSFIEVCEEVDPAILEAVRQNVTTDGCSEDFTPIADIVPVVQVYTHAFARQHVLGEPGWDAAITNDVLHPEVVVTTR